MPKATFTRRNYHSVLARNEVTALIERIDISRDIRERFADIGKPRKIAPPRSTKVKPHVLTLEERLNLAEETVTEMAEKHLLHDLIKERNRLDHLTTTPIPLIDRITPAREEYHPPAPIPDQLKFRKDKILKRIEEHKPMFEAVKARLGPYFNQLAEDMTGELIEPADNHKIWQWWGQFQDLYDNIDNVGHDLTNKEWRGVKGAMRRIGRISLTNYTSKERSIEIGKELAALNLSFPAVSN